MVHELKCWPEYFEPILSDDKTFEARLNDRDFKVGDVLWLREWVPPQRAGAVREYTGRDTRVRVTYIMTSAFPAVRPGWVVMALGRDAVSDEET